MLLLATLECGGSPPFFRVKRRHGVNIWEETFCSAKAGASSRTPKDAVARLGGTGTAERGGLFALLAPIREGSIAEG